MLIQFEEAGDAIGFGETFDREAVGGHVGLKVAWELYLGVVDRFYLAFIANAVDETPCAILTPIEF